MKDILSYPYGGDFRSDRFERYRYDVFDEDRMREPGCPERRSGDWFEPLGTRGSQKIKKLFYRSKGAETETRSNRAHRRSGIGDLIENMHLSERVKVSPATKNVLILEIRPWP